MRTGSVVTIGTFDGVHLGHRAVLDVVASLAASGDRERIAYVFEAPPRTTLENHSSPRLLLPIGLRQTLLRTFVDRVEFAAFDAVPGLSPEAFVGDVLVGRLRAGHVVVGEGFRFGRSRAGDVPRLSALGRDAGFDVHAVPPAIVDGAAVSSTRIRRLLGDGRVRDAAALLGRPPVLVGRIAKGDGIGRRLGYPTANLSVDPGILLPADGIYLAHAFADGHRDHGLLYVGDRPTLEGTHRRCEIHLLSPWPEELRAAQLQVHVLERVRDDRAFPSVDALSDQIGRDVAVARKLVGRYPLPKRPIGG